MAGDIILIEAGPGETRVALMRDGRLMDLQIDRPDLGSTVGNIYLGRVEAVLPGIAAAFVDIGLERSGFLGLAEARAAGQDGAAGESIGDYLSEGDAVLVQVLRDSVADKGAKLTTHITLTGRRLILMPGSDEVRLSRRIDSRDERKRLEEVIGNLARDDEGFILRTAATGAAVGEIETEAGRLRDLWAGIEGKMPASRAPARLHTQPGAAKRMLRDEVGPKTARIVVEGRRALADLRAFCAEIAPDVESMLNLHEGPEPLFEAHGVEEQIEAALDPIVALPSGGRLIVEETAALTAIDIDTGGRRSGGSAEDVALHTNLEAAEEIARQLRLRNLAGIVVVDFVPIKKRPNSQAVLDRLRTALAADKTPANLFGFTRLGLVEMTRQRRSKSLRDLICEPCPHCSGIGWMKSRYSLACEGLRRTIRASRSDPGAEIELIAAPGVIETLTTAAAEALAETEEILGRPLRLIADGAIAPDHIEVIAARDGGGPK
ncbi:MAG: Rne/Rng family ribonuclease [Rhodospirillales bacterium]|nr:Rne/Rng family ribonuclease [Rhodospirillales bacterium]